MKKFTIAGILLLCVAIMSHTFFPNPCSEIGSFTFQASTDGAVNAEGMAFVELVDTATNVPTGEYSDSIFIPAAGKSITVPKPAGINVRAKLTWHDGYVSFAQSSNNICNGLPIMLKDFQLTNKVIMFNIFDESRVVKYRLKQSTDYQHWITITEIKFDQFSNGYYSYKL